MKSQKSSKIMKYDVVFEEASEGGFTVSVPALPGCISEGDTFEEASKNIKEAIELYLEILDKDNIKPQKSGNTFIGTIEVSTS